MRYRVWYKLDDGDRPYVFKVECKEKPSIIDGWLLIGKNMSVNAKHIVDWEVSEIKY